MARAVNNAIIYSSIMFLKKQKVASFCAERSSRSFGAIGSHQADVTVSGCHIQT